MSFLQAPPQLGNQYDDDRLLQRYLERVLPPETLAEVEPELRDMGELAGGELYRLQLEDRLNEPELVRWGPWGDRRDEIRLTPLWRRAQTLAAEHGLVAMAYESAHGPYSRVVQFALAYLFDASTDVYTCPLAMTDGAAAALLASGNQALIDRAVPRLTSRDPQRCWTSGQWMTETPGGSDVSGTETVARRDDSPAETWRPETWWLYGRKWFTSAATSEMALTLARPEGADPGAKNLALFYLETRDGSGNLDCIRIERLKDKLGTRKVPTAELFLEGTPAVPVKGLDHGVRHIAPMLNVTRTWNAVVSAASMRRGLALAYDYAEKRRAFGAPLAEKPLHRDTLAGLQADFEAAFLLAFRAAELLGLAQAGELPADQEPLLRLVTPLAKLTTAKQAVAHASEVLESFGGAGYVEDTGLPRLLRDAQVLPIWEGTTNVLSLDVLRALGSPDNLEVLEHEIAERTDALTDPSLQSCADSARNAVANASRWWTEAENPETAEAGARRFALTLSRAWQLALLCEHAQWDLTRHSDDHSAACARRFNSMSCQSLSPSL